MAARAAGRRGAGVLLLPRVGGLCPDLQVHAEGERIVGYVEAKRPGENLENVADRPQLRRYRASFPNLLLTDFCRFILFRDGVEAGKARLDARRGEVPGGILDRFFSFRAAPRHGAAALATGLAHRTRHLKDMIEALLDRGPDDHPELAGFFRAFSEHLLAGLDHRRFADLYAQTLAFGLFAARLASPGRFSLRAAFDAIPESNGLLRDAFRYISICDPVVEVRWILQDIVEWLADAEPSALLGRRRRSTGQDPIHHFYETFLAVYDPAERRRRGVFYTPRPLVSYMVGSVEELLRRRLGLAAGFADRRVTVLDPAAGTATFLARAFELALAASDDLTGEGAKRALVRDHLLPHFHAFELMMAPYAVGHLQLGRVLADHGCPLVHPERPRLFLTDALDTDELAQSRLPGMASLSRESHAAAEVKRDLAISVVLGNPPYRGHAATRDGGFFHRLLREGYLRADGSRDDGYYRCQGRPLGERNPKWLQDDYVRFLRFAQWKIDRRGEGIVAFVTNHGYLENPTFRGLRESLLGSFDQVYVLDLHGNAKKGERSPDGGRDENVFDIRPGVAVGLLVKKPGLERGLFRADLWGRRHHKLAWLDAHRWSTTPWQRVEPRPPLFLFAPGDARVEAAYERFVPLAEVFPVSSVGIVTGRDALAVAFSERELYERIGRFRLLRTDWATAEGEHLGVRSTRTWDLAVARQRAAADPDWHRRAAPLLYRPFDRRFVFYADYLVERPRRTVLHHLLAGPNLGLIVPRQGTEGAAALVTDALAGHKSVSAYDVNSVFPLLLYPAGEEAARLFEVEGDPGEPAANLSGPLLDRLAGSYGRRPRPEEILGYVYAVLWSPRYRETYHPLLSRDFPRLPFPADADLFARLARLGARLVDLHLLRAPDLEPPRCRFEGEGSGVVDAGRGRRLDYHPAEERLVVNPEGQAFTGIPPAVWRLTLGGHRVLARFLRDRAGRPLALDELERFARTVTALAETLAVEREIDALYPEVEADLLPHRGGPGS